MRNNKNILVWAIVLLTMLNFFTVGTIIYHNYKEKQQQQDIAVSSLNGTMINGRYMRQHLNFNNSQVSLFRDANRIFRPRASDIVYAIDSLKNEMFAELAKPLSDTGRLNDLSYKIGGLHSSLKQETFLFYLKVKAICDTGQQKKLENLFAPLFKADGAAIRPDMQRGKGYGPGWGGRNGFRNQIRNNNN